MIVVTGATGFVGGALTTALRTEGRRVVTVRRSGYAPGDDERVVSGIDEWTDWTARLDGVRTVVHCAARVHQMREGPAEFEEYRRVNVLGTLRLAEASASAGAERFVFLSSIKVTGDVTAPGQRFGPETPCRPLDAYGRSKAEAEDALRAFADRSGVQVVIVRPTLVYGPGAKGNIDRLLWLLRHRIPMPLGAIGNRRSVTGLTNLVDFLRVCVDHQAAAGRTFVVSDDGVLSTTQVLRTLGEALGRRAILLPVPVSALRVAGRLSRAEGYVQRLTSDLEVDASACRDAVGWHPIRTATQSVASVLDRP